MRAFLFARSLHRGVPPGSTAGSRPGLTGRLHPESIERADHGCRDDHPGLARALPCRQVRRVRRRNSRSLGWFRKGTTHMRKFGGAMILAALLVAGATAIA